MRDPNSRPHNKADIAIKSAYACRHHVGKHELPVEVDIGERDEEGVQYVTYTCTHAGEVGQKKVRIDHRAGTAYIAYDTGFGRLLEQYKGDVAAAQRAALGVA